MERIAFCARRTHWAITTHANRQLRKWNLTAHRVDVFVAHRLILFHHGGVRQSSLRAKLGITRSTMCIMMQRMERRGFIERRRSDYDRRQIIVTITAAGQAAFEKVRHLVDDDVYREIVDFNLLMVDFKTPVPVARARFLLYLDTLRGYFGDITDPPYPREASPRYNVTRSDVAA
jgi:DNA-binding MarR family transcriptional regulator